ncbi:MAG: hypothetical protein DME55_04520 [Verrucomicrobia bacterium]|nr:MAG: hypothetical protein DME55_04520 [Verrucomicrobiota bacterium]
MIIRDAVEADLPIIVEIYNATVPTRMVTAELEPTTVETRLPWFREHSPEQYPFWVAELEGHVIAWLDFKKFLPRCAYRGTAEISVYVDEEFRRRGVGQRLLEHAIARAPSLGITALVVMGRHCPARSTAIAKSPVQSQTANHFNDCLNLMHTLMEYRHEPIHSKLLKIRDKYSMLHLDVLILIYHFAKICSGNILEIGAFVGGATIAAAFGVRDSGMRKKLISIEPGGSVKHKRLGTRNIFRDLERNLARQRVSELVSTIKGRSFDPTTITAVNEMLGAEKVGLLILDADAAKRRDIECYCERFADGCWMVIDDYYGADANAKITPSRADVDSLTKTGCLEPLGFYGWSTWVGRWRGPQR